MTASFLSLPLLAALGLLACASKQPTQTAPPQAETEVQLEVQALDVDAAALPVPDEVLDQDAAEPTDPPEEPEAKPLPDPDQGPQAPQPSPQH